MRSHSSLAFLLLLACYAASSAAAAAVSASSASSASSVASSSSASSASEKPLTRIALGSCNKQELPQPLWSHIAKYDPDVWIWLGDIVYGDKDVMKFIRWPASIPEMKAKYDYQKNVPDYVTLRKQLAAKAPLAAPRLIGIWDDHDYGENDGTAEYIDKVPSQELLMDFLDEPDNSKRRTQKGTYVSYVYGPPGKQVKVILLDNRYSMKVPTATEQDDILGAEQWAWLEKEISKNTAQLTLIGAGLQIVSWGKYVGEGWARFPASRTKLFNLLARGNPDVSDDKQSAFLLMSGDVHFAEGSKTVVMQLVVEKEDKALVKVLPVFDLTTSGLTHSWGESYGPQPIMVPAVKVLFPLMGRTRFTTVDEKFYPLRNWGSLDIDWDAKDGPEIMARVHGVETTMELPGLYFKFKFSELQPRLEVLQLAKKESLASTVPKTNLEYVLTRALVFACMQSENCQDTQLFKEVSHAILEAGERSELGPSISVFHLVMIIVVALLLILRTLYAIVSCLLNPCRSAPPKDKQQ